MSTHHELPPAPDDASVAPPTRRRVVGHAAWAVPALVTVAAAPAMAASCTSHNALTNSRLYFQSSGTTGGIITSSTVVPSLDVTNSSTAGRFGWQLMADTAASHTLLTYSVSVTLPYQVTWDTGPTAVSGWTRTVVATTAPNRWTYTWTAGAPVLPRTMLANTPAAGTTAVAARALTIPDFLGSVTHANLIAWRPVGTQLTGNPWTYPTAYTSTYQFNAGSGCAPGIRTFSRTGSFTLQHTS